MNRRGFLSLLGLAAASAAVDPEKLLWTPGKLISIPKVGHLGPQYVKTRLIRFYDPVNDIFVSRMDVLYGPWRFPHGLDYVEIRG